jgi:LssY C-terminus
MRVNPVTPLLITAGLALAQIRVPLPASQLTPAPAQATSTAAPAALLPAITPGGPITLNVTGTSSEWLDTALDVRVGDQIDFSATGSMDLGAGKTTGPQGANRGFRDVLKAYTMNDAGQAALIGRIGNSDVAIPFLIGTGKHFQPLRAGRLFLNVNKAGNEMPDGTFAVTITFASRGPEPSAAPANLKLPVVTKEMIDRIPRRVIDAQGNAGDNTNFVVVGNEQKVIATFTAAGWVKVDRDKKGAIVDGFLATLKKQAYLTLPMSELTLFNRVQDYGLAHAEPIQVVSSRNHLRLWKAPFQVEGQELWVGAATHDIGFDRDQRNNGVTHKIDPDIDLEREYVGRSLDETGMVAKLSYILPSSPSQEAKTATGATFHSDGRVLVIHLMPE